MIQAEDPIIADLNPLSKYSTVQVGFNTRTAITLSESSLICSRGTLYSLCIFECFDKLLIVEPSPPILKPLKNTSSASPILPVVWPGQCFWRRQDDAVNSVHPMLFRFNALCCQLPGTEMVATGIIIIWRGICGLSSGENLWIPSRIIACTGVGVCARQADHRSRRGKCILSF